MRTLFYVLIAAAFLLPVNFVRAADAPTEAEKTPGAKEKFVVYYADTVTPEHFAPYQLLVFDSTHHPSLQPLKEEGKVILGYMSLGEVEKNNPAFGALKNKNLILQENQNWKGSYFVDMRDPLWPKMVLEELIPSILAQGFDGLFLDTLDNPVHLEDTSPEKYAGMKTAAAHLVEAIRMHYPSIKIMMNRGYGILPQVASKIDMELGESVYADYDFAKKTYGKVEKATYDKQIEILKGAREDNPKLKIYTLDYADPSDHTTIQDIYRTERANGFTPYVATIGLDRVVDEPGSP